MQATPFAKGCPLKIPKKRGWRYAAFCQPQTRAALTYFSQRLLFPLAMGCSAHSTKRCVPHFGTTLHKPGLSRFTASCELVNRFLPASPQTSLHPPLRNPLRGGTLTSRSTQPFQRLSQLQFILQPVSETGARHY